VIPEGAGGVIGGNVDLVFEYLSWCDFQKDIVAVPGRGYVKAVKMQVRDVEAARYDVVSPVGGRAGCDTFLGQVVVQRNAHRLRRIGLDDGCNEGVVVSPQVDWIVLARIRIVYEHLLRIGVADIEVDVELGRPLGRRGRLARAIELFLAGQRSRLDVFQDPRIGERAEVVQPLCGYVMGGGSKEHW
jgi:hypothetical protein